MMDLCQAKELFYEILQEINTNMGKIRSCNLADEEAERQLFSDVLAPIIIKIEELYEGFLSCDELELSPYNINMEQNALAIVTFFVLSYGIGIREVFDDWHDFVTALNSVSGMQSVVDELLDEGDDFDHVTLQNLLEVL